MNKFMVDPSEEITWTGFAWYFIICPECKNNESDL